MPPVIEPEPAAPTQPTTEHEQDRISSLPHMRATGMADHSLLLLDPQELGAEVSGALVAAQLAVLPSGETETVGAAGPHQPTAFQAVNDNIMGALGAAVGVGKKGGVGVTLDPSAWPIVHGSRGSEDRTAWRQPRGDPAQRYYLFSSQSVQEDEEANALYMGHLLVRLLGCDLVVEGVCVVLIDPIFGIPKHRCRTWAGPRLRRRSRGVTRRRTERGKAGSTRPAP